MSNFQEKLKKFLFLTIKKLRKIKCKVLMKLNSLMVLKIISIDNLVTKNLNDLYV